MTKYNFQSKYMQELGLSNKLPTFSIQKTLDDLFLKLEKIEQSNIFKIIIKERSMDMDLNECIKLLSDNKEDDKYHKGWEIFKFLVRNYPELAKKYRYLKVQDSYLELLKELQDLNVN